jgi:thiol-disulfide isomerase/thioredoxin
MKKKISIVFIVLLVGVFVWFISERLNRHPELINGKPAIDFRVERLDGQILQLSDLQGQYILLDFWASWCRPCRKNNPKLVELYKKLSVAEFKDAEGFEIISIAVKDKINNLQAAIEKDQLLWPYHVIDSSRQQKFDNGQLAEKYDVQEIPSTFLIDPEGMIIGVDLTVRKIEMLLSEKLEP